MNPAIATLFNAGRIVAGPGSIDRLLDLVNDFGGRRVLIVSDQGVARAGLVDRPRQALIAGGIAVTVLDDTPPEPEVKHVEALLAAAKAAGGADIVVGIGGGSAMDVAKILAVLLAQPVTLSALLAREPIRSRGLPTVMVPTTAGTGSEATPNAIFLVPEDELKVGIVSPNLMPDGVILDPLLTLSLPPSITASTGMDALTHAIECYCSKKGNPFSDLFGLEADPPDRPQHPPRLRGRQRHRRAQRHAAGRVLRRRVHRHVEHDGSPRARLPSRRQVPDSARPIERDAAAVRHGIQSGRIRASLPGDGTRRWAYRSTDLVRGQPASG